MDDMGCDLIIILWMVLHVFILSYNIELTQWIIFVWYRKYIYIWSFLIYYIMMFFILYKDYIFNWLNHVNFLSYNIKLSHQIGKVQ